MQLATTATRETSRNDWGVNVTIIILGKRRDGCVSATNVRAQRSPVHAAEALSPPIERFGLVGNDWGKHSVGRASFRTGDAGNALGT
jgi:hypothetical protein